MSAHPMRLADLMDAPPPDATEVDITGLTADSREVRAGFLFAALPGSRGDGNAFVPEATARGAAAILTSQALGLPATGPVLLRDENPRRSLAVLAARFFGRQPDIVVGVTGTNGKTSVAEFTRQIWCALGRKAASIGTLGVRVGDGEGFGSFPAGLTTPDPVTLHRALAELAAAGFDHVAMEASSHGLDQFRLDGVRFSAAALTNVTRDHLDYHQSLDAYRDAKLRLFREVLPLGRPAVLNTDADSFAPALAACETAHRPVLSVGQAGDAIRLIERNPTPEGQDLVLGWHKRVERVHLPLVGDFQASNALLAAALAVATGEDGAAVTRALAGLRGVPGRLEFVGRHGSGAPVYVDYAHTPDALATVLEAVRPHTSRRLVLVFGCGGDRDRGKRPEMGEVAARLADRVIVTDDNPRSEDPAAIRATILTGCPNVREIGDRAEAIATAIGGLERGDLLLLAGKGHETGQIVGDRVIPFDDRSVARAALGLSGGDHG